MAVAGLVVVGLVAVAGCSVDDPAKEGSDESPQARSEARPRDLATARRVIEDQREALRKIEGANGSGVGVTEAIERAGRPPSSDDEVYVIVVYLRHERYRDGAPASIDGVPLRYVVTGIPRAQ